MSMFHELVVRMAVGHCRQQDDLRNRADAPHHWLESYAQTLGKIYVHDISIRQSTLHECDNEHPDYQTSKYKS